MAIDHDREREELLEDLEELRESHHRADPTSAIGVILILLVILGAGWFSQDDETNSDTAGQNGPVTHFVSDECKVSGCNGELCIGINESIASTCVWQEQFACYQEASTRCEIQTSGKCGWTKTPELSSCLAERVP